METQVIELNSQQSTPEEPIQKESTPTYDPKKMYKWKPEDMFTLNGLEFDMVYNSLLAYVNSPEVQQVLLKVRAFEVMQHKFKHYVELGIINERPQEDLPQ